MRLKFAALELDLAAFAQRLLAWRHQGWHQSGGVVFDCGSTTSAALERLRHGSPAESAGDIHDKSQGNGSLMRALPAAFLPILWGKEPAIVIDAALRQSRVTHAHPVAQIACAVYSQLAQLLLEDPGRDLAGALQSVLFLVGQHPACAAPGMQVALKKLTQFGAEELPTGGGYVLNTFWSAIWCLRKSSNYLAAVRAAISLGNDTDTTACVTGGLAAIRFGLDSVPREWWSQLRVPAESRELLVQVFGIDPWPECSHKDVDSGDGSMAIFA